MDAEDSYDNHIRAGLDVGEGHYVFREFLFPDGTVAGVPAEYSVPEGSVLIGIMDHHPRKDDPETWCGGWLGFLNVPEAVAYYGGQRHQETRHVLVSETPLTIAPSLGCRSCPSHGFIEGGRWRECG